MSRTYRVLVVGMGKRGTHHASAFKANGRFEVAGLCDIDAERLKKAAGTFPGAKTGTDAARLAAEVKPDVFCFCTLPTLREKMVQVGIDCGAKLVAFEKPIALSSREARAIKQRIDRAGVKAVVSHQHRYGTHYGKVREIVASGAIGKVHTVYGTATGWMLHMLSHLIDYARWYNDNADAQWVMGQAAGRGKFADLHPSPDYIAGFIHFANGVRGIVEAGAGAPDVPEVDYWWRKARVGAQGDRGFAEALTGGGWRAVTPQGCSSGPGSMNYDLDMPPYVQDMAEWLDGTKLHPCNFDSAYRGHEIMMALCRSAVEGGQIALPLGEGPDEIEALKARVPDRAVLLSMEANRKEYLG